MCHVDHPRFFAFVPSPGNFVGAMADALAAGMNPFVGTWLAGSGPAEIELITVDWLREMCGLPETAGGLFVSGGSMANLTALAVARDTRLKRRGGSRLHLFFGPDAFLDRSRAGGARIPAGAVAAAGVGRAITGCRSRAVRRRGGGSRGRARAFLRDRQCGDYEYRRSGSTAGAGGVLRGRRAVASCRWCVWRGVDALRARAGGAGRESSWWTRFRSIRISGCSSRSSRVA